MIWLLWLDETVLQTEYHSFFLFLFFLTFSDFFRLITMPPTFRFGLRCWGVLLPFLFTAPYSGSISLYFSLIGIYCRLKLPQRPPQNKGLLNLICASPEKLFSYRSPPGPTPLAPGLQGAASPLIAAGTNIGNAPPSHPSASPVAPKPYVYGGLSLTVLQGRSCQ